MNGGRIWSDILEFGRIKGGGVVGFGWTGLDWVGLGRTGKTSRTLLCQKRFGGQAGWTVRQPPSSRALWRSGKRFGEEAEKKVGRIWSDMVGFSRMQVVLRSIIRFHR